MGRVYSVASNGTWVSITPASTLIESSRAGPTNVSNESGSGSSRGGLLWLVPARSGTSPLAAFRRRIHADWRRDRTRSM